MKVTAIPAFRDNYVWALHDDQVAILFDPGEAAPILTWLASAHLHPMAILVTHHHADHVGGIPEIVGRHAIPVYGPAIEAIPGRTQALHGGETLHFDELGLTFQVLATPGHTRGHLCFFGDGRLFCGDTLFSCGCGRLFEGTPEQMHTSLSKIKALPMETLIYCAHEYTLANLAFALEVEPDSAALQRRLAEVRNLRTRGTPSLPSNLATEMTTNPFLRCEQPDVVVAAARHAGHPPEPGLATFAALRAWKDAA